jgi:SAM-dependent methyltransferase
VKTESPPSNIQKKFDFSTPKPRPFLANLPAKIEIYEDGIAEFFRKQTSLDYYLTIDRIIDFVVDTGGRKVLDLLADTAVFALNLAVSIFDFHRHSAEQYLKEIKRVLVPNGYMILAEMIKPKSSKKIWNSILKKLHLHKKKNDAEAAAVYYDQEEMISLIFQAGFRQVIIQGLNVPANAHSGVFSLITAIK